MHGIAFAAEASLAGRVWVGICKVHRLIRVAALCLSLYLTAFHPPLHSQITVPGDDINAVAQCLKSFPDYVKFPPRPVTPNPFGILGEHPVGTALEKLEAGVRRSEKVEDLKSCQVVFIAALSPEKTPAIFEELEAANVLTVGVSEGFAKQGGVIGFVFEGGRLRFEINTAAAARAGLRIDSRLLRLAVRVFSS